MAEFDKPPVLSIAKRLWVHGFLVGFVAVGLFLGACLSLSGRSTPLSQEEMKTLPPTLMGGAPAIPGRQPLNAELEEVLSRLQEATLAKNLVQFFSVYSAIFPHLNEKRRKVAKTWQTLDYTGMRFRLAEVSAKGQDQASALVTWEVSTRDRRTGAGKELTRSYLVQFNREFGHWHIAALYPED